MDMSTPVTGLSQQESGDFQLVCRLYELHWSDFEVHVEHEAAGGIGRKGRKLAVPDLRPASHLSGGCRK